jgi:hypothetical protein
MVKEELYIDGQNIELIRSLNPNLTFNIADIAKPDTRSADFSKTIELPASKKINKIFEHIFKLDTDLQTFNPNLKTNVVYLVNGEVQIDGYLQLKSINNIDGEIIYNCIIIGRIGNFIGDLQELELTDLDLSSLDHTYTRANQSATWNLPLTTDYCYPMINYDKNYGTSNLGLEGWNVEDFYPAIKVKKYVDEIFSDAGYSFTSTFLTSDFFNTLIVPFGAKDFKIGESGVLSRIFNSNTPQEVTTSNTFVTPTEQTNATTYVTDELKFTNEVYDAGNVYDNTTGIFEIQAGKSGFYDLNLMLQLQGVFDAPTASGTWEPYNSIHGFVKINKFDSSGVFISTIDDFTFGITAFGNSVSGGGTITTTASPTIPSDEYFYPSVFNYGGFGFVSGLINNSNDICNVFRTNASNVYLETGQKIKIIIKHAVRKIPTIGVNFWYDTVSGTFSNGSGYRLNILDGYFKTELVNTNIVEGSAISINDTIPTKIKQKDFIMSLVKMFNLYIQPDPNNNKNLIIEPREDFYTNDIIDWSNKVDKSKNIESKPMGALNFREYIYTYKNDKDYYNKLYFDTYDEVYGQDDFKLTNQFITNKHKTEIIFSPTPNVGQEWYDRVIPTIIKFDDKNGVQRTEANIRILQWGGMKDTGQQWYHTSRNSTPTLYSTYPYAGMYDDPYSPTTLLEFGISNEIYYSNVFDKIVTFSDNTLFNKYHSKFIQEITDNNSKIVNGFFYLTPSDIKNLSFSSQYYFEGQYFRLNKVENYNPINPITKCEFLKINIANVFSPSNAVSHGGGGLTVGASVAAVFSNGSSVLRNGNVLGNLENKVIGSNNYINKSSRGISIMGDSNRVFSNAKNVNIKGSNNIVESGCENVELINSDNQTVTASNVTYINNEITGPGSTQTITSNTKANLNVQIYYCDASSGSFSIDFSPQTTITVGKSWTFKKVNSANQVTIDSSTIGSTIDGANTYVLSSNYKYVTIQFNGVDFLITSNN